MPDDTASRRQAILDKALEKLEQLVEDITNLEVVTVVGAITAEAADGRTRYTPEAGSRYLVSRINLVDGDMVQMIDPALLSAEFQWLRSLHAEREAKAQQVVKDNVETIRQLIATVSDLDLG